jgi:hypothetical protein
MQWISRRDFQSGMLKLFVGSFVLTRSSYLRAEAVGAQPLVAQVRRLLEALEEVGDPLPLDDMAALHAAFKNTDDAAAVAAIQSILDRHVLLRVAINPEGRISITRGSAPPTLVEAGWRTFLVRVDNQASDKSALQVYSPQARPMGLVSGTNIIGAQDSTNGAVDAIEARDRWIALATWTKPPLDPYLSGLQIEYRILQVYSRDPGKREADFEADADHGAQDLGYRSSVPVLFDCMPSFDILLRIQDVDGSPTVAGLIVTDHLNRVYPPQGKRALPDLWFQKQIYRKDGESLRLPAGGYSIEYGRGPEYLQKQLSLNVGSSGAPPISIRLERWIKPSEFGYYSGDTHIHAAGCAHYESPTEGVTPDVMYRQVEGEALDIGDVLTWAPGFYYQRQFFTGHVADPDRAAEGMQSSAGRAPDPALLRYDVEVSGFPSSHCGHLVLWRLKDMNYPGAQTIDQWPSWNVPILKWAKAQGAVVGYAHSANGMAVDSTDIPNYLMPRFDSSGANEYLIDVTHEGLVDFLSGCDGWPFVELNTWYHVLNCGFRTPFAGETDFPCLTDRCVGGGRSYVKLSSWPKGDAGYSAWVLGVKEGRSYVGDGRSHIFNFSIVANDGKHEELELTLQSPGSVHISAQICARLEPNPSDATEKIRNASPYVEPLWHLERSRVQGGRSVAVELIVNGIPVKKTEIEADGEVRPVEFDYVAYQSSWIALRIYPSSHTNPIFVFVGDKPVRASKPSAEWCRQAVDVLWKVKSPRIRPQEIADAQKAFDHARTVYECIIQES